MANENNKRRKRMNSKDRKEQILNVTCDLFSKYGYDAVTTKQLSEAVGCSEALIFKHFPSKEAIYSELMEEWEKGMKDPVELELVDDSPIKTLEKMYVEIIITKEWNKNRYTRPHLESAIISRTGLNSEHYRILGKSPDVVTQTIMPLVIEGQKKGEIREGDPLEIAHLFWIIVTGSMILNQNYPGRYPKLSFDNIKSLIF